MGSGHGHGHPNAGATHRWRLRVAFALVAAFFVVELVLGLAQRVAGAALATPATWPPTSWPSARHSSPPASRPAPTPPGARTFGSYRAEVFASGLAVLLMLGVSVYIVVEAVGRIGDEPEVASAAMLVVGALGLVVNLVALLLLRGGAAESLNVKGAYLEVVADTLGSVGVIVAGLLVAATGSSVWDTVVALAIAAFVAVRAVLLGREVARRAGPARPGRHRARRRGGRPARGARASSTCTTCTCGP